MEDKLLTINDVAKKLRVTSATVFRLMKKGELTFVKVSRRFTRIRERDLEDFIDRHTYRKGNIK